MTKAEYEKYHKEVFDKYGNQVFVGDTVAFCNSDSRAVHLGVVDHFTRCGIIIKFKDKVRWTSNEVWEATRTANRVIKIQDGNSIFDTTSNEHEVKE